MRLRAREESKIGTAKREGRAKGLTLTDEDVRAPLTSGLQHTRGDRVGADDEECVVDGRECLRGAQVLEDAQVVGVRRYDGRGVSDVNARPVGDAVTKRHLDDLVAGAASERASDFAPVRMHARGDHHLLASGRATRHVEGLDEGRRGVVERGIGNRQSTQTCDQRLVLEDGLEHTLGNFGLVRRVSGNEFRAVRQHFHHGGHFVVVRAAAREAGHRGGLGLVGARVTREDRGHVGFTQPVGDVEAVSETNRFRNVGEEIVEGVHTEERQHRRNVFFGMREIVSHLTCPFVRTATPSPTRRFRGRATPP